METQQRGRLAVGGDSAIAGRDVTLINRNETVGQFLSILNFDRVHFSWLLHMRLNNGPRRRNKNVLHMSVKQFACNYEQRCKSATSQMSVIDRDAEG